MNFFIYYNKNNHLIVKPLTLIDDYYQSENIDENFFIVGLYINGKKMNSTDLHFFEQAYCLSDYNNLKDIQPNYYREANEPLIFSIANLQLITSGTGLIKRFEYPQFILKDLNNPYFLGEALEIYFNPSTGQFHQTQKYKRAFLNAGASRCIAQFGNIFFAIKGVTPTSEYIQIIIYPDTNVFHIPALDGSVVSKYGYEDSKIQTNGHTSLVLKDLNTSQYFTLIYTNYPIKVADL